MRVFDSNGGCLERHVYVPSIAAMPLACHCTVMSPPFGVTGRPVAVSKLIHRYEVDSTPVSENMSNESAPSPVTLENGWSAASMGRRCGSAVAGPCIVKP